MGPACAEIGNACRIAADVREWGPGTFGTDKAVNIMASYNGSAGAAGAWPDPDLLFSYAPVGGKAQCGGAGKLEFCTGSFCDPIPSHSQAQWGLWAVMGAPLLLSFDLTRLEPQQLALYGNAEIIAVNQDKDKEGRGVAAGRRVSGGDFPTTALAGPSAGTPSGTWPLTCGAGSFAHSRAGVESFGLQPNHHGDASAAACLAACCEWQAESANCTTWQFNPSYRPRGYGAEPCWGGVEKSIQPNAKGWVGGSAQAGPPPPAPAINIWARNLFDGSTALIFINSGHSPVHMQCDTACIAQARLAPGQYKVRDLYARKDVAMAGPRGDSGLLTVAKNGFAVGLVPGDAGSVLWRLTPVP